MDQMKGRVSVVTGGSSGIGCATALELAKQGSAVGIIALPGPELADVTAACRAEGARAASHVADVSSPEAIVEAFDHIEQELGPVDAVYNNAGISIIAPITATTDEQWRRLVDTNLNGGFYIAREAARRMVPRRRGAIVSTASELSLMGEAGYVAYTATKGAILAMTRALAAELAPFGIRVNAVCPGATDTPMLRAEYATSPDPARPRPRVRHRLHSGVSAAPATSPTSLCSSCRTWPLMSPARTTSSTAAGRAASQPGR